MKELTLLENKIIQGQSPSGTDPSDSPSIKRLLDVVVSIIADEYIQIAKQNPDVFSNNGGQK